MNPRLTISPQWLEMKNAWSEETFGPGRRLKGVLKHIEAELAEVEEHPDDLEEWCDIILLAMDGAYRQGHTPEALIATLRAKQMKNVKRTWPDWRTMSPDEAIGHVK